MGQLFTIGYSGQDIESFVRLLTNNAIDVVCDVRSTPFSSFKPDFSRAPLKASLNSNNIRYVFLGSQLGARPEDRTCYVNGQATYDRIAKSLFFHEGLKRVMDGVSKMNLALVCSERDPLECHRAILVCHNLPQLRDRITHIHGDGKLETQEDFDERLVKHHGTAGPPLLRQPGDWEQAVEAAYTKQASAIAYRERGWDNREEEE